MSAIGAGCVEFGEFDVGDGAFEVLFSAVVFAVVMPSVCRLSEGAVFFSDGRRWACWEGFGSCGIPPKEDWYFSSACSKASTNWFATAGGSMILAATRLGRASDWTKSMVYSWTP